MVSDPPIRTPEAMLAAGREWEAAISYYYSVSDPELVSRADRRARAIMAAIDEAIPYFVFNDEGVPIALKEPPNERTPTS